MNDIPQKGQLIGAICAGVALFCLLTPGKGAVAYLQTVGAPPLRFWVVTTNDFNYSRFKLESALAGSKPMPATGSNAALATRPAANTNDQVTSSSSLFSTGKTELRDLNQVETSEENAAGEPTGYMHGGNFSFPSSTASDLLSVTPQMIAQFLKPDPHGTNSLDRPGAVVFIPADTPFMPPAMKGTPESQANYRIQ